MHEKIDNTKTITLKQLLALKKRLLEVTVLAFQVWNDGSIPRSDIKPKNIKGNISSVTFSQQIIGKRSECEIKWPGKVSQKYIIRSRLSTVGSATHVLN